MNSKPNYSKTLLLFSGGMDSIMAWKILKPDYLLYILCGSKYQDKEVKFCEYLIDKYKAPIIFDSSIHLAKFERTDLIIPLRNLLFISIATFYSNKILIGAMNGDRVLDKSLKFISKTSSLLKYLYQPQHWIPKGRKICIKAIFDKEMTKTKLVAKYLLNGYSKKLLQESISCYSPLYKHCGKCKPCFRKWVALINNGINVSFFKNNPRYFQDWNKGRGIEDIETENAIKLYDNCN